MALHHHYIIIFYCHHILLSSYFIIIILLSIVYLIQTENVEELTTRLEETEISDTLEEASHKSTRAAKRKAKKTAKEQERDRRIVEADAENVNSARNIEAEKMKQILKERNLEIFEVKRIKYRTLTTCKLRLHDYKCETVLKIQCTCTCKCIAGLTLYSSTMTKLSSGMHTCTCINDSILYGSTC